MKYPHVISAAKRSSVRAQRCGVRLLAAAFRSQLAGVNGHGTTSQPNAREPAMGRALGSKSIAKERGFSACAPASWLGTAVASARTPQRFARTALFFATLMFSISANAELPVDKVSQNAIQSALQILRRDYIRREDLTFDQLNRAALQGLLTRLDFGAAIVKDDSKATKHEGRVFAETLGNETGYLRPVALIESEVPILEAKLRDLAEKGSKHFVLDLRSPTTPGDFETAAAMLELFLPRGTLLFKLKQPNQSDAQLMLSRREPVWRGPLVVLIDNESSNIAETIAAVLKNQHRAILVGSATRGATVRYETVPLDKGWKLRFARAEMLLPDESSVFRKGVSPDFVVNLDDKTKRNIFDLSAASSIKPFVFEQARPRFNEAALVANRNPELDDYIRRSSGETLSYDQPPARDAVLQRALDLILAGNLLDPFASPLK